jgi:glyoxylase-like metal-dependent hydrolase (beta-lactamase superfamily II)
VLVWLAALGLAAPNAHAQASVYNDSLLPTLRALVHAVPGDLPTAVSYLSVQDDSSPLSDAVAGAPKTRVFQVTPVFQVRYPHGWVMVDAGYDKQSAGTSGRFYQDRYDEMVKALRGAGLIVVTHEHGDHVETLLRPDVAADVAAHTLLNAPQVETLIHKPKVTGAPAFTAAQAAHYLVVDYPRVLPIAPGVVLIRAPGHTPGSQMVYVRLASGRELVLAGDVAWHSAGVERETEKPDSTSRQMQEDRATIAQQLGWLHRTATPASITVVVSHDGTELQSLVSKGILSQGLDLAAAGER